MHVITRNQLRGAEVFTIQLCENLLSHNISSKIISIYPRNDKIYKTNTEIIELNRNKSLRWVDFKGWKILHEIIKSENPDLIQANASETLKFTVMSKIIWGWKVPIIYRNASLISGFKPNYLKQFVNQILINRLKFVVSVSSICQNDFVETFTINPSRISTIPIGVKKEVEISHGVENILGELERPIFINIASLVPEKNHSRLLKVFDNYRKYYKSGSLIVIGDGKLRTKLGKSGYFIRNKEQIRFLGYRENAQDYLSQSDVLVMTSNVEGLPGVILEAMCLRIPVVSTDVGGISEAIKDDHSGFLCNDVDSLVKRMNQIVNDRELKERITNNAYNTIIEKYDIEVVSKKFADLYETLLH